MPSDQYGQPLFDEETNNYFDSAEEAINEAQTTLNANGSQLTREAKVQTHIAISIADAIHSCLVGLTLQLKRLERE